MMAQSMQIAYPSLKSIDQFKIILQHFFLQLLQHSIIRQDMHNLILRHVQPKNILLSYFLKFLSKCLHKELMEFHSSFLRPDSWHFSLDKGSYKYLYIKSLQVLHYLRMIQHQDQYLQEYNQEQLYNKYSNRILCIESSRRKVTSKHQLQTLQRLWLPKRSIAKIS